MKRGFWWPPIRGGIVIYTVWREHVGALTGGAAQIHRQPAAHRFNGVDVMNAKNRLE